jgi:hypothetical protein
MSFENLLGKSFPVQLDERVTQMEKKIYTTIRDMKDKMQKLELIDKSNSEKTNEIIDEDMNKINEDLDDLYIKYDNLNDKIDNLILSLGYQMYINTLNVTGEDLISVYTSLLLNEFHYFIADNPKGKEICIGEVYASFYEYARQVDISNATKFQDDVQVVMDAMIPVGKCIYNLYHHIDLYNSIQELTISFNDFLKLAVDYHDNHPISIEEDVLNWKDGFKKEIDTVVKYFKEIEKILSSLCFINFNLLSSIKE